MKKFKILACLLLITSSYQVFAQDIKKGEIVFAPDFNSPDKSVQWAGRPQWVREGVNGGMCLFVNSGAGGLINTTIDLSPYKRMTLQFRCLVKAEGVTKPSLPYLGIKYMLHFKTPTFELWRNEYNIYGTFNWKELKFTVAVPYDVSTGIIALGLQGSTGKVWFDSVSVSVVTVPVPFKLKQQIGTNNDVTQFRGAMSSGVFKKDDIKTFGKDWKGNLLRWQLSPNQRETKDIENNPNGYDSWIDKKIVDLDSALILCKQYNIKLVIDLHIPIGKHDSTGAMRIFYDKKLNEHFIAIWQKIAQHFKSNSTIWGYDLINEPIEIKTSPEGMDNANTQLRTAEAIRKIDPSTPIIIEVSGGDSPNGFGTFTPFNISNLIYEVHMYDPPTFTHQGILYPKTGIVYPGIINGINYDKNTLKKSLKPVRDFQLMYHVPIFVGEFSAARWAPGAAQYLDDCISIFEEYGWNWTYHAFRESPVWSVEYENGTSKTDPVKISIQDTDRKKVLLKWFAKNRK